MYLAVFDPAEAASGFGAGSIAGAKMTQRGRAVKTAQLDFRAASITIFRY